MTAAVVSISDHGGTVDYGRSCAPIPPGQYEATFTHHETAIVFKSAKLFVWFRLVDPGPYFGVAIYKAYRVKALTGPPRRNGGYIIGRNSDVAKMLVKTCDVKNRPDRLSAHMLAGKVLTISVRTVTTDYRQRSIPEALQYSVVADVVRSNTG